MKKIFFYSFFILIANMGYTYSLMEGDNISDQQSLSNDYYTDAAAVLE